jgi:hypothetical protein
MFTTRYFALSLLLLDVVSMSETLRDVVRAVVRPLRALMLTAW